MPRIARFSRHFGAYLNPVPCRFGSGALLCARIARNIPTNFTHRSALFPLRDENPTLKTPVITVTLIVANVVVWLYVQGAGYSERVLGESVCWLGLIPAEVTGVAAEAGMQPCVLGGLAFGAVVTSMFLHAGWLHLLGNMWFLWLFGNNVEDVMGHARFLAFYILVGLAASAAHVLSSPGSVLPTVGASGAISGIMGAYLMLYPRVRIQTLFVFIIFLRVIPVPAWLVLVLWFALQVLTAYATPADTGGVAVWAHVGGFVAGLVLVRLFVDAKLVAARRARAMLNSQTEVFPG
jgi:membrane associated rhomboid family serine protease